MKTKTITVRITKELIGEAKALCRKNTVHTNICPLALALKEGGFPKADVTRCWSYLQGFGYRGSRNPPKVERFIKRFDSGQPVKPFSFRLKVPR